MDQIRSLGTAIGAVVMPTSQIYGSLLKANSTSAINGTRRETHPYGSHPRQQLDLYLPSDSAPRPSNGKSRPIFVFAYGGGFVNGDKVLAAMPEHLVYKNVGYFFAEKLGFETIVMDYRLIQHGAVFPSGGEDIGAALEWIEKRGDTTTPAREIFIMGNSAGGVHLATWLFGEQFAGARKRLTAGSNGATLRGVVFLGAPFHFNLGLPGPTMEIVTKYFGGRVEDKSPLGLVQRAEKAGATEGPWPRMLVIDSELDPDDLKTARDFLAELRKIGGIDVKYESLQGHNHISPPWALGTGIAKEEQWGYDVGDWINGR